ncbi:MAG: hypothetical protein IJZ20_00380 [Clostridia bacterium]|nr:hypothetical protein [Clostridia bacterium]
MASEMLEKILEAENSAKEKLEITQAKAREIIEKAKSDGEKLLSDKKKAAEEDRMRRLSSLCDEANEGKAQMLSEAQKVCDEMSLVAATKSDECTRIILEKLMS